MPIEVKIACWLTRGVFFEYNYTVGTIHLSENNIFKCSGAEVVSNFTSDLDGPGFNVTAVFFHWTRNFAPDQSFAFFIDRGYLAPSVRAS